MCYRIESYYDECTLRARRARVSHRCDECGQVIDAGERYLRTVGLLDGDWITHRQCRRCVYDRLRIRQAELAEGCRRVEAEPADGELLDALCDRDWAPTPADQVPAAFDVASYFDAEQT